MIRKGKIIHKGFAFSGDDQSGATVVRSLSIINQKNSPNAPDIEEEKSKDGLELSLQDEESKGDRNKK